MKKSKKKLTKPKRGRPSTISLGKLLSEREEEVAAGLKDRMKYKEIADKHFISVETVRTHVRNLYAKLKVHNRKKAVAKFFRKK